MPPAIRVFAALFGLSLLNAQTPPPTVPLPTITLPGLGIRTVATGLTTPTGIAFLTDDDFFVIEKNTGKVKRVLNGVVTTVLDLGVNYASERGLLGIALGPGFPADANVYLYWTCIATGTGAEGARAERECAVSNMFAQDTAATLAVPLLGNRVDRFKWDATAKTLTFDRNIVMLRAYQNDGGGTAPAGQGDDDQIPRGNHDGGVIGFGPDGKLYIVVGDLGRRGQLQNLRSGPTPPLADDQFGGPQPDDAHMTGVVLRLNPDGSAPEDNPFVSAGTAVGGEIGDNLKLVYAYGIRNSFGLAFEPKTGSPWITEHGDDTFDEINRIRPGQNGGWVQVMGPMSRIGQFSEIESTFSPPAPAEQFPGLQQLRWPSSSIATSQAVAASRLFMLPGAQYSDPEFSWKWATLPVGLEFVRGPFLGGAQLEGDLIVSLPVAPMGPGYLIRLPLNDSGDSLALTDARLQDRVADNNAKYDLTESEGLVIGSGYGIATDLEMSPGGTMFVVSFSNGEIYELYRLDSPGGRPLTATLAGGGNGDSDGTGTLRLTLNQGQGQICYELSAVGIDSATAAHIHAGATGVSGAIIATLNAPSSGSSSGCVSLEAATIQTIRQNPGDYYVDVHNAAFPNGAIRGQLGRGN